MKVVLEIKNELDLALLLPLLERLKIPFTLPKSANGKKNANGNSAPEASSPPATPHPAARFIGCFSTEDGEAMEKVLESEFNQ